ncbi:hypothetical protein [Hymenobacter rubidus]|uniref:hypothetical protein n=1 Tax=Hymenobacter rubidus TaxID=1441626 RepID=UPI00191D26CB|nr:hypothetical protein [Hymenobacter rubidus]
MPQTIAPSQPLTISNGQFNQYAANWLALFEDGAGDKLANNFLLPADGSRLPGVSFPVMSVVDLVSALGVTHIKARFLAVPDEAGQPHFAIALFAANAGNETVSAYYVSEGYWQDANLVPPLQLPVANVLALHWANSWADAATYPITAQMFNSGTKLTEDDTGLHPLQGYTFGVSDFLQPLQDIDDLGALDTCKLRAFFGLRTYANVGEVPAAIFGLMLRLTDAAGALLRGANSDAEDMASPCPPSC